MCDQKFCFVQQSEKNFRKISSEIGSGVIVRKILKKNLHVCKIPPARGGGGGLLPIYDIIGMCGANSPFFSAARYMISPLFLRESI